MVLYRSETSIIILYSRNFVKRPKRTLRCSARISFLCIFEKHTRPLGRCLQSIKVHLTHIGCSLWRAVHRTLLIYILIGDVILPAYSVLIRYSSQLPQICVLMLCVADLSETEHRKYAQNMRINLHFSVYDHAGAAQSEREHDVIRSHGVVAPISVSMPFAPGFSSSCETWPVWQATKNAIFLALTFLKFGQQGLNIPQI